MSNYPTMSESEQRNAPWNKDTVPEKDFDINVEVILRKELVTVKTNDYNPASDNETSDTDWEDAYKQWYYPIPRLLSELERYVQEDIARRNESDDKLYQLRKILNSCKGWKVVEELYDC